MPDLASIDRNIDPCSDFYHYACDGWLKANPLPADQTRWRQFSKLQERNIALLYRNLISAANHPETQLQRLYGNFFAACMDVGAEDKMKAAPLSPLLASIAQWKDKSSLAVLVGFLEHRTGNPFFFVLSVGQEQANANRQIADLGQGVLSLDTLDAYVSSDPRDVEMRQSYQAHVSRMFVLLGDTREQAVDEAASVLKIETALAAAAVPDSDLFDPMKRDHTMTLGQLQALSPDFKWHDYFQSIGKGPLVSANVDNPEFYRAFNKDLAAFGVPELRSYLRWQILHAYAPLLGERIRNENFAFFEQALGGQKTEAPQWLRCTQATDRSLGDAVGQDWVKENFPPGSKLGMERMVASLRLALHQQIESLEWMSPATKLEAEDKLDHLQVMVGYPDRWRSYAGLALSPTGAVANQLKVDALDWQRELDKIGKPTSRDEWFNTPPTVNAYTSFANNQSVFPAGILQPPFFEANGDPATNYGAIGAIIGHEITHGFDNNGRKYDAEGRVRDWWTPQDEKHFTAAAACIETEYGDMEVLPGLKQNGKLTLPENIADNGGLMIAYKALMSAMQSGRQTVAPDLNGFSPAQRFFIGYAQTHCDNQTELDLRRRVRSDPHSEDLWRVNGTVRNLPEFPKAFGCKVGQYEAPTQSCHVW